MLIDARCNHCHKFLCQISRDLIGVVRLKCSRCDKENDVSLATVLKQAPAADVIITLEKDTTEPIGDFIRRVREQLNTEPVDTLL